MAKEGRNGKKGNTEEAMKVAGGRADRNLDEGGRGTEGEKQIHWMDILEVEPAGLAG